jgi:SAM-dependent methyltransferase
MHDDSYKITFETWNRIAEIYQEKFMNLDLYDDTYDFFCTSIEKRFPKVLEIGCGPGNITRYLFSKRPDMVVEGIDIAPNMIELAKKNNPAAEFKVMDCRELNHLSGKYNAIICGFCMPYLSKKDSAKLINDCGNLLETGGIFYFSVIEGKYENSGYEEGSTGDKSYVYYYNENQLIDELAMNKLELLNLSRKEYPKTKDTISSHLIFIARKTSPANED